MWLMETIAVAFSMFSAVPMPQFAWNQKNMRYTLCAFPLVGALIGLLCLGAAEAGRWLGLPALLRGALLCVIPVWVTGGIHLDGYCDTWDALASHGSRERKLEILKDPHIGSFAAIRLCAYFLVTFALWCSMPEVPREPLLLSFCLSRTLSGLAVASFPAAKDSGLAHTFREAADRRRVRAFLIALDILICFGIIWRWPAGGGLAALAAHLVLADYYFRSRREFGGITGDLAGWFLQRAELCMLAAFFLAGCIGKA